jgi:hypothetical protein
MTVLTAPSTPPSSSHEIRGRIADHVNKLISHFYGARAPLSASNFPGAATCLRCLSTVSWPGRVAAARPATVQPRTIAVCDPRERLAPPRPTVRISSPGRGLSCLAKRGLRPRERHLQPQRPPGRDVWPTGQAHPGRQRRCSSRRATTARGRRPLESAACCPAGSAAPPPGAATLRRTGEKPHGRGCAR